MNLTVLLSTPANKEKLHPLPFRINGWIVFDRVGLFVLFAATSGKVELVSLATTLSVTGGFAEVSNNKVTVLAEAAERAREIDIDRAQRAKERAEKRLAMSKTEAIDYLRAEAALKRSLVRLSIGGKGR